jgi:hypothetical protein
MVCSGANGLGLALVIPATQSLIADLYPPEARGRAFGLLLLFSGIGARPAARARAPRPSRGVLWFTACSALRSCLAMLDRCQSATQRGVCLAAMYCLLCRPDMVRPGRGCVWGG